MTRRSGCRWTIAWALARASRHTVYSGDSPSSEDSSTSGVAASNGISRLVISCRRRGEEEANIRPSKGAPEGQDGDAFYVVGVGKHVDRGDAFEEENVLAENFQVAGEG